MKNFKSELIFHFNKSHIDKLRHFIKETNNKNLSIITKNPRRFVTIDYNDSSIGFNIDKDFLKKHPKNDFLYLVFNADETNNLDEWLNYAFSILDYENNQELFNLQIDNSTLSLCLYADTNLIYLILDYQEKI